jgi:hypothetical protein
MRSTGSYPGSRQTHPLDALWTDSQRSGCDKLVDLMVEQMIFVVLAICVRVFEAFAIYAAVVGTSSHIILMVVSRKWWKLDSGVISG